MALLVGIKWGRGRYFSAAVKEIDHDSFDSRKHQSIRSSGLRVLQLLRKRGDKNV